MRSPCCCCCDNKGAWTKKLQEDQELTADGEGCWRSQLPRASTAGLLRGGRRCRLRRKNHLRRPGAKRGNFSDDEEDLIIRLHSLLGNRWSLIAGRLPGRTDNEVKNYWTSYLRRKVVSMAMDPNNHPLSHSLSLCRRPPQPLQEHIQFESSNPPADVDKDSVLDAGSSQEEQTCMLPDLNLDLTISLPSNCLANPV